MAAETLLRRVGAGLGLVLALAPLAACGWTSQVTTPSIATPAAFPGDEGVDPQSIADLPWWRYFGDPQLVGMIETGLANNQNLAVATARVDRAAELVAQARAQALPQVEATLATSPASLARGASLSSTFFGGLQINWQIDFWGRYHAAAQAARETFIATQADKDAAVQSLVASIATTWFQLRDVDEQIRVAEANAADADRSRRLTEMRSRQGVSSAVEVRQAETQLYSVRDRMPALRATAVQLQDALAVLLGQNPGQWTPPDPQATADLTTYPEPPVGLPSALLQRRPDVLAAQARVRAAGFDVLAAQRTLAPSIGLTAAGGRSSSDLSDLVRADRSAAIASVGPSVSQPIFTGGALVAQIKQARSEQAEALASYRLAVQSALQNVDDALAAYRLSADRMTEAGRLEAAARETDRLAEKRFQAGVTSFLEVLDAQRELYSAQVELSQAKQYRNQAAIDLYRSLGGGWSAEPDRQDVRVTTVAPARSAGG